MDDDNKLKEMFVQREKRQIIFFFQGNVLKTVSDITDEELHEAQTAGASLTMNGEGNQTLIVNMDKVQYVVATAIGSMVEMNNAAKQEFIDRGDSPFPLFVPGL